MNELSTADLLRIFLLKFLKDEDIQKYLDGQFVNGTMVDADGTAINTREEN